MLNLSTMRALGDHVTVPNYDPREVSVGAVHIGIGAFHRAHQAVYLDDVLAGEPGWGICGVAPRDPSVARVLRRQDGLYTVTSRARRDVTRVVASIRETLCAAEEPEAVAMRIADPAVRLVTITVTEKAYRADLATRRLRVDAELTADAQGRPPRTVLGLLAFGLRERARVDAPLTIAACDNLSANGRLLAGLLGDYFQLLPAGDELADWVHRRVSFPCTVVDRIVPATTESERDGIGRRLGVRDDAAVVAEPFGQWIIEDDFAAGNPQWTSQDVRLVPDAEPYERLKLRVVNAAHSTLAYLGLLAGYDDVPQAARDATLRAAVNRLLDEDVLATLTEVPGAAVATYRDTVLDRFANPSIRYPLRQVGADGSQKLPQRLVPVAAERLRAGHRAPWVALGVAAWMMWIHRCATGDGEGFADPAAAELLALGAAGSPAALVGGLLSVHDVFGREVADSESFRADVRHWATVLWSARPPDLGLDGEMS